MARPRIRKSKRPRPLAPPPTWSARRYIRIAPPDIALFRFLLEAHDNLALFTVVDRARGVLLLRYSPQQEAEVEEFLAGLEAEMAVERVLRP